MNDVREPVDAEKLLDHVRRKLAEIEKAGRTLLDASKLDGVDYPYECHAVPDQTEKACQLTAPAELPKELKDLYKIDPGLVNIYATKTTLLTGVQACYFAMTGKTGTVTVSGMSARKFDTTRPKTKDSQHNFGKAFDIKLHGRMKSDGNKYDQTACAELCLYCVQAGAKMVIFSDQVVVDAVNKATGKTVCRNLKDHENHVHMDMR